MKVLLNYSDFPPVINGGSIRAEHLCRFLVKNNVVPYLVTSHLKVGKGTMLSNRKEVDGVNVSRIKTFGSKIGLPPGYGGIPFFTLKNIQTAKKEKVDIMHFSTPSEICWLAGYYTRKFVKKPCVFEMRDPWLRQDDKGIKKGVSRKSLLGKLSYKIEDEICRNAEAIVVTNPSIKEELLKLHKFDGGKVNVVYNGAGYASNKSIIEGEKFIITYFGMIYGSRVLEELINVCSRLNKEKHNVCLQFIGDGPARDEIKSYVESIGLKEKTRFVSTVKEEELEKICRNTSLFYVGLQDTPSLKYALPSKIFDAMGFGKPVIATGAENGELHQFVKNNKIGDFCKNEDEIYESILGYYNNKKKIKTTGEHCLKLAKTTFSRESQNKKILELYGEIA
ncbi:MAG: glycosyltransferase family 4 protein [Candidatus Nanoarchaeia archaeon]|nr:glycosyltransferase family 4 protein [Candidatus Nanoarchaeia archaeon]